MHGRCLNFSGARLAERAGDGVPLDAVLLLRAGGLSARELRTMIVLESSLLGLSSTAAGLVMGYALSWILIHVINKQSFGWTIDFHTPAALIAASLAITFLSSAFAGLVPARLAARIDIAAALKSE